MAWTIEYARSARKFVEKLNPETRKRIRSFLEERLATLHDPRQVGDALQGARLGNYWRYRVGDYRIICDLQDSRLVVLVIEIGNRRDVYR
ncbi:MULTISPECIES: type II toxin-antitoxin system RelE/ParE family toxin [unclassified Rhizobium]|uniref:type II toxin-antitoxin system RelE family toxin n=1 Tax=Rhizobium TaxID=379 RepID=UPI0009F41BAA|nr:MULTISPECIES: type II toxin-antitoxin system RelE/ParE family toxin [unclassified Rhizobium]MDK4704147.1 type II toxin-antitoxin system RelE/ParE family toxin [Rhizobium sp. CNPSo 4062]QYA12746.1 type II toxin-antitoxin system RelE/ParE family toxin [Rhizobium sp. AB2/73]UEQ81321.1 type II toxin-antitoxin system RelE/ParE family toxin [Rhizobium sp. AB2/73]